MIRSTCNVQSAAFQAFRSGFRTRNSVLRTLHSSRGFTYVALLAAIVIIGISMGAAGKYWSFVMQREREEELLFRGEQYRLAIEQYYVANCGKTYLPCPQSVFPQSIENLLTDNRFPQARRHLRQQYQDPMTGKDFELIRDLSKGNRITGVFSPSDKEPIRKTGFPEQYQSFENRKAYKEWQFVYSLTPPPPRPAPPAPGGPNAPTPW